MILFLTTWAKKLTLTYSLYFSLDLDEVFKVHKHGAIQRPPNISRKIKQTYFYSTRNSVKVLTNFLVLNLTSPLLNIFGWQLDKYMCGSCKIWVAHVWLAVDYEWQQGFAVKNEWQMSNMSDNEWMCGRQVFFLKMRKNTRIAWQLAGMQYFTCTGVFHQHKIH